MAEQSPWLSTQYNMIYLSVDEIPEDRYIDMVLSGDEDDDMDDFDIEEEEEKESIVEDSRSCN